MYTVYIYAMNAVGVIRHLLYTSKILLIFHGTKSFDI